MVLYVVHPEAKFLLNNPVFQPNPSASACLYINDKVRPWLVFLSSIWGVVRKQEPCVRRVSVIDTEKKFNMALLFMLWWTKFIDPVICLFLQSPVFIHSVHFLHTYHASNTETTVMSKRDIAHVITNFII